MEVRTWRKQREVYSAQINRVNLQSNDAFVNINFTMISLCFFALSCSKFKGKSKSSAIILQEYSNLVFLK